MKKILYFDDDQSIGAMLEIKFKSEGYDVKYIRDSLATSKDLIQLVMNEKPDIIISDVIRPGMNGFEMLEALKKDQSTKDIPFFFHTNLNQKDEIKKAIDLGVTDYFVNADYTPAELVRIIKDFFSNQATYLPQYKKYF